MSILERLRSKRTSDTSKKKLLKEVQQEAYEQERKKVKLEAKQKQADTFLKEVKKAKKAGAEKARMGGKTHSIDSLIKRGKKAKKLAVAGLKTVDKGLEKTAKVLDKIEFDEPKPKKRKAKKKTTTKKKTPTKKKSTTKKKTVAKKKPSKRKPLSDKERTRRAIASGK